MELQPLLTKSCSTYAHLTIVPLYLTVLNLLYDHRSVGGYLYIYICKEIIPGTILQKCIIVHRYFLLRTILFKRILYGTRAGYDVSDILYIK